MLTRLPGTRRCNRLLANSVPGPALQRNRANWTRYPTGPADRVNCSSVRHLVADNQGGYFLRSPDAGSSRGAYLPVVID